MAELSVIVRRAAPPDVEAIAALWLSFKRLSQSVSPIYDKLRSDAAAILRDQARALCDDADALGLVAVSGEEIVGFLAGGVWSAPAIYEVRAMGYVSDLFVEDRFRRHGVATKLLAAAEAHFRARGLKHMRLETIVHYPGNRAFYETRGFSLFIQEMRKAL